MDLGTTIIVVIIVALLMVPFVLDHFRRKRNGAGLAGRMHQAAHQQQSRLKYSDVHPPIAIGLDGDRGMLFFFTERIGDGEDRILDLATFRDVELVKSGAGGRSVTGDERMTRIMLKLTPKEPRATEVHLVFYEERPGELLGDELQLAAKWALRLNKYIRK